MENRTFSEEVSEATTSAEQFASLEKDWETESEVFLEFSVFVEKLDQIITEIKQNKAMSKPQIRKAVESLEEKLGRAKALTRSANCGAQLKKQIEGLTHDLGRSLGLVLFASHDVSMENRENIEALRKEMMSVRFDSSLESESVNDFGTEETGETEQTGEEARSEIEEEILEVETTLNLEDVVLQLKYGSDDEFRSAILALNMAFRDGSITNEWISDEGVIPILFNRLGSSKPINRLTIIQILRILAAVNAENMDKMADVGCLSTLVKSLARDEKERREAVGLLLSLSDVPTVRRRIGRIQGCILMLVAILNGDDPAASQDAGKLLNALSSNTQNALHMAEAGYFKPIIQYLKEGSDMSKILMATALSKMELTDQSKASLGEGGAIEPLVKMFNCGKLEAKLSSLNALQNLSSLKENILRLISTGIVSSLLQLLFSVTSVLMTLREPAAAILAKIAQSESILVNQNVAQQMLSLLNLSSPVIQHHLLQALNSIASHHGASKIRRKMKENAAIQLLLPFLTETNSKTRTGALELIYTLSKDSPVELTEQLGETHLNIIINVISSAVAESERAAAVGILSSLPVSNKKATDILKRANVLPTLFSIMNSGPMTSTQTSCSLAESIAGLLIRITVPSDKKLQQFSVEQGAIPFLVRCLSNGSPVTKCRAATSLAQLSQNSLSLKKSRKSSWFCVSPPADSFCEVHDAYCSVQSTFCLIKAGAVSPLIQILEGNDTEADEAVLSALATLLQDEIWESGSNCIAQVSGVNALIKVLGRGTIKSQEKALWILERIFRSEDHKEQYGKSAEAVLIDLAQNGDLKLKSSCAKLLAQFELLQHQSSYF
ncbi:U-box domain-containing protein 44-like [Diospyros lotus]|uniref:U-box domain-containing protein 44-like n=1 Tax=Diospyros lotus TaxID=55363 RepID=UPI002250BC00|nr:U-box domain-containing protein 44-like [Diospyros lotus]